MSSGAFLLAAALAGQMTVPLGLLEQPCISFVGTDPIRAKPAQGIAIGYVRGYVDASAKACDEVNGSSGFCMRLRAAQVSGDVFLPSVIAEAVFTYCARLPQASFGDAIRQFLTDKGVLDAAPAGKQ